MAANEVCKEGPGLNDFFGDHGFVGVAAAEVYSGQAGEAGELAAHAATAFTLCRGQQGAGGVDVGLTEGVSNAGDGEDEGDADDDPLAAPEGGEEFAEVYFVVWVVLGFWSLVHRDCFGRGIRGSTRKNNERRI